MIIKYFSFNLFQEKTYVLWNEGASECVVIDPGFEKEQERKEFEGLLDREKLTPAAILLTHGHIDHIYGVKYLQDKFHIPVYMNPNELKVIENDKEKTSLAGIAGPEGGWESSFIADSDIIAVAGFQFKVITTPGHSPGSVCYLDESNRIMFTGDTLFAGTIGRSDLMFGNYDDEIRSIMEKLIWLDPSIEIYPGHGPSSNIGRERRTNPFLEPWGEAEEEVDPETLEPISIVH